MSCVIFFLWWVSMNVKEEWKVHLLWMRNLNTYQLMTSVTGKWLINSCDQHQPSKSEFLESEVWVYTHPLILYISKLTPGRLCSIPCYFLYKASDVLPMNNFPFAMKAKLCCLGQFFLPEYCIYKLKTSHCSLFLNSFTPAEDDRVLLSYQDGSMIKMEGKTWCCL